MMIRKMISSGAQGVARAALEAAVKLGISIGGWTPESDPADPENLVDRFGLKALETGGMEEADRLNLLEADATLLLTRGQMDPRTEKVRRICTANEKPCLHLDLKTTGAFQAARKLARWLSGEEVQVLHVAGSEASDDPAMTRIVPDLLEAFFYLHLMPAGAVSGEGLPAPLEELKPPSSVSEAVARLKSHLPLKDKTTIANMSESELAALDGSLGDYIRNRFQLLAGNHALLESCRWISKQAGFEQNNAAAVIIRELWKDLKQTHTLRIIK
jgi:hypothetical protein